MIKYPTEPARNYNQWSTQISVMQLSEETFLSSSNAGLGTEIANIVYSYTETSDYAVQSCVKKPPCNMCIQNYKG